MNHLLPLMLLKMAAVAVVVTTAVALAVILTALIAQ
jgi:hypothetical protein